MLGHGCEAHGVGLCELANGGVTGLEARKNPAARGVSEGGEGGVEAFGCHALNLMVINHLVNYSPREASSRALYVGRCPLRRESLSLSQPIFPRPSLTLVRCGVAYGLLYGSS